MEGGHDQGGHGYGGAHYHAEEGGGAHEVVDPQV